MTEFPGKKTDKYLFFNSYFSKPHTPAEHARPSAGDAERGAQHTQPAGAETISQGPCGRNTNQLNRRKQGRRCEQSGTSEQSRPINI